MNVVVDSRVNKIINRFSRTDRSRIQRTIELFEERGFDLNKIHLKRLTKNLWELRPGNIRLLFGLIDDQVIIVNAFVKKTNKTPPHELQIAERRFRQNI